MLRGSLFRTGLVGLGMYYALMTPGLIPALNGAAGRITGYDVVSPAQCGPDDSCVRHQNMMLRPRIEPPALVDLIDGNRAQDLVRGLTSTAASAIGGNGADLQDLASNVINLHVRNDRYGITGRSGGGLQAWAGGSGSSTMRARFDQIYRP